MFEKVPLPDIIAATGQGYRGVCTMYKLTEPFPYKEVDGVEIAGTGIKIGYIEGSTNYVLVNSSSLFSSDKTIIYPCNEDGVILSFITTFEEEGIIHHDKIMRIYFGGDT